MEKELTINKKYSREVIRNYAKSFWFASRLLPSKKRQAAWAIYAFCRYADNIVDKQRLRTNSEIISEIDYLRNEITIAYRTGESEHPALAEFIRVAMEYKIPVEYPLDLLKGIEMDLTPKQFQNFDELYIYCYRVASVVGLMMTYILGFKNSEALIYAEKLGIGMQHANILRDIKEDKLMGRIYLPVNELNQFSVSADDIFSERFSDNFIELMKFQVNRANQYFRDADLGIAMLDRDARFSIYSASRIYNGILKKIEKNGYNPFLGRVYVPTSKKLSILVGELIKNNTRILFEGN
jgi:15-cis-phytoene synthase